MKKFQILLKKTINDFKNREINAFTNAIWFGKNKQIEKYLRAPHLINKVGSAGATPLLAACRRHNTQLVKKLLNLGADPQVGLPLEALYANIDKNNLLTFGIAPDDLPTGIHNYLASIQVDSEEIFKLLIEHGAVPSKELRTQVRLECPVLEEYLIEKEKEMIEKSLSLNVSLVKRSLIKV